MENVKTTSRKGRTLRKENAGVSTSESTTVTAPAEVEMAPLTPPATTSPTGQNIVLMDSRLTQFTHGWGKAETKDAREVVSFAISQMVGAAESKISVGEKFNKFAEKHGDKVNILIKESAKLGIAGLTESNIALWRIRAREIPKYLPNASVRRFVLAMTGGEGIIIRDEDFSEKDSEGKLKPKPYVLSPFWAESIKTIGPVPESDNEEIAELYARKASAHATFLRTKARTEPEDARIRKQFTAFQKRAIGWLKNHETLVYERLGTMLSAISRETTDLDLLQALVGKLDKVLNAETETSEVNGKQKAAVAKVA